MEFIVKQVWIAKKKSVIPPKIRSFTVIRDAWDVKAQWMVKCQDDCRNEVCPKTGKENHLWTGTEQSYDVNVTLSMSQRQQTCIPWWEREIQSKFREAIVNTSEQVVMHIDYSGNSESFRFSIVKYVLKSVE